jgi:hypothetical protein
VVGRDNCKHSYTLCLLFAGTERGARRGHDTQYGILSYILSAYNSHVLLTACKSISFQFWPLGCQLVALCGQISGCVRSIAGIWVIVSFRLVFHSEEEKVRHGEIKILISVERWRVDRPCQCDQCVFDQREVLIRFSGSSSGSRGWYGETRACKGRNRRATPRQSVPMCAQFLWAYLWAGLDHDQAGIIKSLGSSPSEAANSSLRLSVIHRVKWRPQRDLIGAVRPKGCLRARQGVRLLDHRKGLGKVSVGWQTEQFGLQTHGGMRYGLCNVGQ